MTSLSRGRLAGPSTAPETAERADALARIGNVVVEEIVSATADRTVEYRQEQDEWVVVLSGSAVLDVEGERVELSRGEWLLLPAATRHRLLSVEPQTQWL